VVEGRMFLIRIRRLTHTVKSSKGPGGSMS
jgi:hypothetical protein